MCLKYLTLAGYDAHEDDGSVFLSVDPHLEIQLSSSEVSYRAELYKESVDNYNEITLQWWQINKP